MALISINSHVIRHNAKHGTDEPPIRVAKTPHGGASYASGVAILDAAGNEVAWLRYSPHKPIMASGARLVLETAFEVGHQDV